MISWRLAVRAYVGKDIKRAVDSTVTRNFLDVYRDCPFGYRFMVGIADRQVVLVDLWKMERNQFGELRFLHGAIEPFRTVDAACVAAVLRHETKEVMRLQGSGLALAIAIRDVMLESQLTRSKLMPINLQWKRMHPEHSVTPDWIINTPRHFTWLFIGICAAEWVAFMGWMAWR